MQLPVFDSICTHVWVSDDGHDSIHHDQFVCIQYRIATTGSSNTVPNTLARHYYRYPYYDYYRDHRHPHHPAPRDNYASKTIESTSDSSLQGIDVCIFLWSVVVGDDVARQPIAKQAL